MIHNHHLRLHKPMKLKERRYVTKELNINSLDLHTLFFECEHKFIYILKLSSCRT
jgi:hypothetical protein